MKSVIKVEMNYHPAVGAVEKLEAMLDLYLSQCYGVSNYQVSIESQEG